MTVNNYPIFATCRTFSVLPTEYRKALFYAEGVKKHVKQIQKIHIDEFSIDDITNKVIMLRDLYEFKAKHENK